MGPILGGLMAGFFCLFLKRIYLKVKEDSRASIIQNDTSVSIEHMLATSMYSQGKYQRIEDDGLDF